MTRVTGTRLAGKTALVAGGTTGIGFAAAERFDAEGARVAITGQNADRLATAARALGDDVLAIRADAGRPADLDALAAKIGSDFGGLDVLFVNAGIAQFAPAAESDEALFDRIFGVNTKGAFFTVQRLLPQLRDGASVIFNTSVANQLGMPGATIYSASKAALRSMVRTLAVELAPRRIRVNAVSPGPIETPIFGKSGLSTEQVEGFVTHITSRVALGRLGQPEEVANAALFLASDEASFVTGDELVVDGGLTQTS